MAIEAQKTEELARKQRDMEEEKVESNPKQEMKTARNDQETAEEEDEDAGFLDDAPLYYQPGIIPQAPLKPS